MSAPDLIHALLGALKELPADRWRCSVDNVRKGPVKEHRVGLRDFATAWARWTFVVDGDEHELEIVRSATEITITLDGAELDHATVDIHPTTRGFTLVTVVRCDYRKANGSTGEYRFDGTNASLTG